MRTFHRHTRHEYHRHGGVMTGPPHPVDRAPAPHHEQGGGQTGIVTGGHACEQTSVIGLPAAVTALCRWALPGWSPFVSGDRQASVW